MHYLNKNFFYAGMAAAAHFSLWGKLEIFFIGIRSFKMEKQK